MAQQSRLLANGLCMHLWKGMGPVHWNASKSSLSNHNSQGIAMQSYGLTARITGYYPDGAFSREIPLNSRFDIRCGLTPELRDVGTEILLPAEPDSSVDSAPVPQGQPLWRRHLPYISRVAASFAKNRAEENLSKDRP